MSNAYIVLLDGYVGDDERRLELIGVFDTLAQAQEVLADDGYRLSSQSGNEWGYSWGWGTDATIVEVPMNQSSSCSSHGGSAWWDCLSRF